MKNKNSIFKKVNNLSKIIKTSFFIIAIVFSITFFHEALAVTNTETISASQTWTAPAGVTSVAAECWGTGGSGGGGTSATVGGTGGGAGAYAKTNAVTVTPGTGYTLTIGAVGSTGAGVAGGLGGDTSFTGNSSTKCLAKGGNGGAVSAGTAGVGGLSTASTGDVKFSGGGGFKSTTTVGGGGGSSGGTAANGNTATSQTAAAAVTGGGPGGAGGAAQVVGGTPASAPGGAGGGGGCSFKSGACSASGATKTSGGVGKAGQVKLTYTVYTALADGTDPSNSTIAPGATATESDAFTLRTSFGTDVVSSVVVGLGTGVYTGISLVEIMNDAETTVYGSTANPASDTPTVTLSTNVLTASTTLTQYHIRITPKTHINMPAVPGASYAVTAKINSWTSTNTAYGSDTAGATITIDNLSPNSATSTSVLFSSTSNTLAWIASNSADISQSVVLRWAASSPGAEVPVEGGVYIANNTITTATIACVLASTTSQSHSGIIDGTGGTTGCNTTALTNGQAYSYKIFQKDSNGNYSTGATFTTVTLPTVTTPTVISINTTGATLGANVTSLGIPAAISARGTCWGTTASPVTNCVAEGATTTGVFTQVRTGLAPGTFYYYRGYAINTTGTGYSTDGTFTTTAIVLPTVTTQAVSSITTTTATGNGNITVTGGENNDLRGVVYDTATHATPGNVTPASSAYPQKDEESGSFATGAFTESITVLTGNTTYYVRAYSHNSAGYSYGSEVSFTTLLAQAPPTIVPNTADLMTTSSSTPTLEMTATDVNVDDVEYNVQISANSGFTAASQWVAVGDITGTSSIAHSSDGITWTGDGKTLFSTYGQGVAYNGSMWVAVGNGTNSIATSPDGINWTPVPSSTTIFSGYGYGVAWNGTMWVAVGSGTNSIAYSYNGIDWTGVTGKTIFSGNGYNLAWNGTMWVATGQGTNSIAYSYNGIDWTGVSGSATLFSSYGRNVAWGNGQWVATGLGTTNTVAYSPNGTSWTGEGLIFSGGVTGIAWNGTYFVIDGNDTTSTIEYSSNGTVWTQAATKTLFSSWGKSVAWNGTKFVASGQGTANSFATSPDGINWTGQGIAPLIIPNAVASNSPVSMIPSISVFAGLDKNSTVDSGFLNTVVGGDLHPFTSGQKVSYTVQAGDALAVGTYYWRVRATDPLGTNTYSSWTTTRSFTITTAIILPTVTTQAVSSIASTTAIGNGNITATGGANNDLRGVVYGTTTQTTPGNVAPASSGYALKVEESGSFDVGAFTENITGLTASTIYYTRAYSHNSAGYSYGSEVSFTALSFPTVTTPTVISINTTGATLGANVTSLGIPATISDRGTCWGTTASPITNCVAEGATTTGVFTQIRTGLAPSTFYYYRGYATNTTGTGYSIDGTFTTAAQANNPVPTTTSISPTSKNIGDSGFTLTVNGTNFISGSVVTFNGSTRTTTYVSATQLTASILISDLTSAGSFLVLVNNPTPGGGDSNSQIFTVHNVIPNITSISPTSVPIGAAQFIMTVNGVNFVSNSQVKYGGSARATTFISSIQLSAVILVSDLASAGTFSITVYNPTTGETSSAYQFTVGPLGRREFNYSKTFYGSASLRK